MSTNQGGITETIASAVNTAAENVQAGVNNILGNTAEAKAQANKEQAKHGSTIGSQIDGATGYLSNKADKVQHDAKEQYHDKKADAQ